VIVVVWKEFNRAKQSSFFCEIPLKLAFIYRPPP